MDNVINICEAKHSENKYSLDADEVETLNNKLASFREETEVKKALHLTMICSNGLTHNAYSSVVTNEINGEDLFNWLESLPPLRFSYGWHFSTQDDKMYPYLYNIVSYTGGAAAY